MGEIWTPEFKDLLKTLIVCVTAIVIFILFIIVAKKGLLSSLSIGKDGLSVKAAEIVKELKKEEDEKQFKGGTTNKLLDDQIRRYDDELVDFAVEQSNKFRKTLQIVFSKYKGCSRTKKALISCIRIPLYEASRRNHFREVCRSENTKNYLEKILKSIKNEYMLYAIDSETDFCTHNDKIKCFELPAVDELLPVLNEEIMHNWLYQIRAATIKCCKDKINLYTQYIGLFKELGDTNRVKITEQCIEKNNRYIIGLDPRLGREI